MISVSNIYKQYGDHPVLNGVTFDAASSEALGILGANGVGKTTLLDVIAGLKTADVGMIRVTDCDTRTLATVPNLIGYVMDASTAFPYMTAGEYLEYLAACASVPAIEAKERIELLLKMFGLTQNKKIIQHYSKGEKQKLSIAASLLPNPDVLLMDEPTNSLDIEGKRELQEIFKRLKAGGKTIIFTAHSLSDLCLLADKVAVLEKGRLLFCERIEDILKSDYTKFVLSCDTIEAANSACEMLCAKDYTIGCKAVFSKVLLMTKNVENVEIKVLNDINAINIKLIGFSKIDVTFDEAFTRRLKDARGKQ